jgi:titin
MFRFLRKLRRSARSRGHGHSRARSFRPAIEQLEARRLLNASGVISSMAPSHDFAIAGNHHVIEHTSGGWQDRGGNAIQISAFENTGPNDIGVFAIGGDQSLQVYDNGSWQNLGGYATQISDPSSTVVWALGGDGSLQNYDMATGWHNFGNTLSQISAGLDGGLHGGEYVAYGIAADHSLQRYDAGSSTTPPGWSSPGGYVTQISATWHDGVWALGADGSLLHQDPANGWQDFGGSFVKISAGVDQNGADEVYALDRSGNLLKYNVTSGWSSLGGGAFADISGMAFGVFAVAADRSAWQYTAGTWSSYGSSIPPPAFTVTSTADSGAGTLRQAILDADANPGADTINFAIAGGGVQSILPTSGLPAIMDQVTLDATTQPGYAGTPLVELNGSMAGNADGLLIDGAYNTVQGLDITGFNYNGIAVQGGGNNVIDGNYIGVDPAGKAAQGNGQLGVLIFNGSQGNRVGTNGDGLNDAAERNIISGNQWSGVQILGTGTNLNVVAGNTIGTDVTGSVALGNGNLGVWIGDGAQQNRIGTSGTDVDYAAEGNLLSGNAYQGVGIFGAGTDQNVVAGNTIGTDVTGTKALGNGNNGIWINGGAQGNRIGTTGTDAGAAAERNLISGNAFEGVVLSDAGTSSNVVAGNLIGTDVTGTKALPNADGGLNIVNGASSNRVGFDGTSSAAVAALERNVISGNGASPGPAGVYIADPGTNGNVLAGNYVGVDVSGLKALGNKGVGIYLANGAQDNRVGTDGNNVADASEANVISANLYQGVAIQGTASGANTTGTIVAGNLIGTNSKGTAALGNHNNGVWILAGAQSNRIGTDGTDPDAAGEGNVLAGNAFSGVTVSDPGSNQNLVAGNWVGTNKAGTLALPNGENGVSLSNGAQGNQVGGSAALGNVIAFNTQAGVAVTDPTSTGDSIRANKIFSNGGLGIDLGSSGVQVNHAGATTGPNNLQNYPLLTAGTPGATTSVSGSLNSLPNTTYTLDFYASPTPDITFYGPGQRYLGSAMVTTDANGNASFSVTLKAATSKGDWVSATATDPSGNTSEFSGDRQLPASPLALSTTTWTPLGPSPIAQSPEFTGPVMSGRVESAAPDPTNPNVMYLTADGGGVWKTGNWLSTSPTWTPLTDAQPSTVTGGGLNAAYKSLAVFPGNPRIVYAAASGPGGGVLKSTDGGASWTVLGSSLFNQVVFGSLVVDPTNANNVFVTVWYGTSANAGGVYKSTDGGVTWTNTTAGIHAGAATDLAMDPTNSSVLYAGLTQGANGGATNGLYKSTDGGTTWTRLAGGLLTGSSVGAAIRVAVAPSSAQTLYATVFDPALGNAPDGLPHRFRSANGGTTWTSLPGLPTAEENRSWHVVLSVDPTHPQTIYVNGDHTVYQSTNGGSTWTETNNSEDPVGGFFDDGGALVLVGDHGIYRGTTFVNKQGNLQTSEFYTLTLDPTNPNVAYGLAQDQFAAVKYTGYPVWNAAGQVPGNADGVGETGKILVNPASPNQLFRYAPTDTSSFILRSDDGGASWVETGTGIPTTLAGFDLAYASQKAFVIDPTNAQRLLVGTNQVYETTNAGASWTAISPVLSPSPTLSGQYITSLAIAPSAPSTVYAATADGRVFVTTNDGGAWTEVDSGLPKDSRDQIVSIQVDPNNANRVFIVPGRFPTKVTGNAHVWMTTTGGSGGWTDLTGNLPAGDWTNSIAVDWRPATPVLYVATARGVYQSADLGGTWSRFGEALPNSPVTDLQLVPGLNVLAAATYGRGVWEIRLGAINHVWTGQGATANWSDANNWSGHTVPAAGDTLVFGPNASQPTITDDLAPGTAFGSIVFSSAGYSVGGNAVTLNGRLDGSGATGTNAFNLGVTLGGAGVVLTGGAGTDLSLGGAIANGGFTLTLGGGAGEVDLTGALSGSGGLTANDPLGTASLSGPADTYTGATTVLGGTLLLGKSGTAVPGVLTVSAGTVRLAAGNQTAATSAVTVSGPGLLDLDNNSDAIGGLTLNAGSITTGTGTLTLGGNVTDTGTSSISGNLALGAAARTFTVNAASTLNVSAVVSGGVGLTKARTGTLALTAANTYTGGTALSAGALTVGNNSALGTGTLTLTGGTIQAAGGPVMLANALTLGGNFTVAGTAALTFSGAATLTTTIWTAATTVTTTNTGPTTFAGAIGQSASGLGLTKAGSGTLVLSGTNTYTGTTTVSAGTLLVNGTQAGSPVSVHSGGTLGGTGVVGNISALSGGHVAPGVSPSQTGFLTAAGVTLPAGSTFNVQANGTTAGSGYSQLSASGTGNITGSTLNFTLGYTPAIGDAFTIINNTGASAVVGTFQGLPTSGSTFTVNGMTFSINYAGGDGNDVVVTRTA